jgi:hypothetical protein
MIYVSFGFLKGNFTNVQRLDALRNILTKGQFVQSPFSKFKYLNRKIVGAFNTNTAKI